MPMVFLLAARFEMLLNSYHCSNKSKIDESENEKKKGSYAAKIREE